jgi:adenine-specific DNA-methyltransferase
MTKVFISGSRRVRRLNKDVKARLDSIIENQLLILVGDANGADKAVQSHLHSRGYRSVLVFCVGRDCRNNVGGWELRSVTPAHRRRDLDYFASKDRQMAREADVGFMIWDAKSVGTILNAARLISGRKKAVVYSVSAKRFVELRSETDLESLLSGCAPSLRRKVENQLEAERLATHTDRQTSLL